MKGHCIMQGYYKRDDLTAETIKNGYLHSGDIGEIDSEGFLKITDRKKEIFKTSGGKYIAPAVLESELNDFCSFYKSVCYLQHNTWPHHFLLNKEV